MKTKRLTYNSLMYNKILMHVGHRLECASYGDRENVAVECMYCMCVLIDFNKPEWRKV